MSVKHLNNLKKYISGLPHGKILDLGSGKGNFLVAIAKSGGQGVGIEINPGYIKKSKELAESEGVEIEVIRGLAENMPFEDNTFDFINISEVIEHVEDPSKLLSEVFRVLKHGGAAYISAPNRFGMKDQHFHLYFVNWLPRSMSDYFISFFGKHKDYSNKSAGLQNLKEMHYYTYNNIKALAESFGFSVQDIRELKIKKIKLSKILMPIYKIARLLYFDSFHLLLKK